MATLNESQLAQYREEGYAAVPDFFTAREAAAMQKELQRLKDEGLLRNVATHGDGKTHSGKQANLQICPLSPHSRFFRALPFEAKVVATVRALIGDPVVLYLDQIFLKPGGHGAGTGWHQDNAYFKVADPTKGVGMWVAIHEATVANGTLHIVPGSHREVFEHSRDPNSDHHIFCEVPEDRGVAVELPAGGVLLFNYGIAHCTRANTTDKERAGLALHFLNGDYVPADSQFSRRMTYLTGPQARGGPQEHGEAVADT